MRRAEPSRKIRALFDSDTIRVYQAFSNQIADSALQAQTFVEPFNRSRMTWIKPSFNWMMYRSAWGRKDGQQRVLAIDISRDGFEWALANSCLTAFSPMFHDSYDEWKTQLSSAPVRIQWDPERTWRLERLESRTIQIGLGPKAVAQYVDRWIRRIHDVTGLAHQLEALAGQGANVNDMSSLLPIERVYPVSNELARRVGCSSE